MLLLALACAIFGGGAVAEAQAPVGLSVIAHPSVPSQKLAAAELAAIFTGAMKNWKDGSTIKLFNAPSGTPMRAEFDSVVLNMTPEQVSRFWIDKRIRGEGTPPRQVTPPELVNRLVATLPGAISYVPDDKVASGVRVVARVRGGKVVTP
jgi:ABC-type phosphate transport system substrate-binding protein